MPQPISLKPLGKGFNFDRKVFVARKAIDDAMSVMATQSLNHFKRSFRNEGFTDEHLTKWKPRKRATRSDMKTKKRRAILTGVGGGTLKRSITKTRVNAFKRILVSDLPYSAIHNEGLAGRAFGKHAFKMPKRQYMGVSKTLIRQNVKALKRILTKAIIYGQ